MRELNKQELDTILKNHNLWLSSFGEKGKRANLVDADLGDADLRYANLVDADLRGANLRYANLVGADLRDADLRGANLRYANLVGADLGGANLGGADLRGADLRDADLDFSALPLWCGGLDVNIDDKQATQLLYHLVKNVKYSKNTSAKFKKLCSLKSIIKQANKFHRITGCGEIVND